MGFRLCYHWLIIEWEPLHRPQGIRCAGNVTKHDKCLSLHFQRLHRYYVQDGAKLRENCIKRLLQFCVEEITNIQAMNQYFNLNLPFEQLTLSVQIFRLRSLVILFKIDLVLILILKQITNIKQIIMP